MTIDDLARRQDREVTWQTAVDQFFHTFVLDVPIQLQHTIGTPGGLNLSWETDQAPQRGDIGSEDGFWWTNKGGRTCFYATVVGMGWAVGGGILPFRLEGNDPHDLKLTVRTNRTVVKRVSGLVLPVMVEYLNRPYSGTKTEYACLWSGPEDNRKIAFAMQQLLAGTIPESEFPTKAHWWTSLFRGA